MGGFVAVPRRKSQFTLDELDATAPETARASAQEFTLDQLDDRPGLLSRTGTNFMAAFFGVDQPEPGLASIAARDVLTGASPRRDLGVGAEPGQDQPTGLAIPPGVVQQLQAIEGQIERTRAAGREDQAQGLEARRDALLADQQRLTAEIAQDQAEFGEFEAGIRRDVQALPESEGVLETITDVGGRLAAGIPQPENLFPVARAATLLGTAARGAAAAGGLNALLEPAVQRRAIERGVQAGFDPMAAAINIALGAGVGGVFNALPQAIRSLGPNARVQRSVRRAAGVHLDKPAKDVTPEDVMTFGAEDPAAMRQASGLPPLEEGATAPPRAADEPTPETFAPGTEIRLDDLEAAPRAPAEDLAPGTEVRIDELEAAAATRETGAQPNVAAVPRPEDGLTPSTVTPEQALDTFGPFPQRIGNIDTSRLDSPQDINALIDATARENGEFITERRGVQTNERTKELARDLNMTTRELVERRRGDALNAEQLLAARQQLTAIGNDVVKKAQRVRGGDDSARAKAELLHAATLFRAVQGQVSGATAEAGRALQALKIIARAGDARELEALSEAITTVVGRKNVDDIAKGIVDAADSGSRGAVAKELDKLKPGVWDKIYEFWINSILSGPFTQLANIGGNLLRGVYAPIERGLAGAFDAAASRLTGRQRSVFAGEGVDQFMGMIRAGREAMKLGARAFQTEDPNLSIASRFEGSAQLPAITEKIAGVDVGKIVRLPGRALTAADVFFQTVNMRAELNALANRAARKEGLSGLEKQRRVGEILSDPDPAMMDAARASARRRTFTQEIAGKTGKGLRAFRQIPGVRWVVPFIRTPTNLLTFVGRRTAGLNLLSPEVRSIIKNRRADPEAFAKLAAETGAGTAMLSVGMGLAQAGLITGSGPRDPAKRRRWLVNHRPYSIKIGDTWVSYRRFDPFAMLLSVPADLYEGATGGGKKFSEADYSEMVVAAGHGLARSALNRTWLSGLSDFFDAVTSDSPAKMENFGKRMATSFIPFSSALRQTAGMVDPTLRDTRDFLDQARAGIPGLSSQAPARRDIFGRPIERGIEALGADNLAAGPLQLSPVEFDPDNPEAASREGLIASELDRLDINVSRVPRKIDDVELTPKMREDFESLAGQELLDGLDQLMLSGRTADRYGRMNAGRQREAIEKVQRAVRRKATQIMRQANPEFIAKKRTKRIEEVEATE
jgi:hypothetical protein